MKLVPFTSFKVTRFIYIFPFFCVRFWPLRLGSYESRCNYEGLAALA